MIWITKRKLGVRIFVVGLSVMLGIGLLSSCARKDDNREYVMRLVPGSLQVLGNADKIWCFIEFELLYHPLKKVRTWDHPNFIKTGARQWILEYTRSNGTVRVVEMTGPMNLRLSWNPNLSRLFFAKGSWHALKTESMFTQTAIYRMDLQDGTFQVLPANEPGFDLPNAPGYKQEEHVSELSAKSGYSYLHENIGISDEAFAFGGNKYLLKIKSAGDCYEFSLFQGEKPVGEGAALRICSDDLIVTEKELKALPGLMEGKPK